MSKLIDGKLPAGAKGLQMAQTVIVRGVRHDDWQTHVAQMRVYFGGRTQAPSAKPTRDASYVAFYQGAPESAITHLGVVKAIERDADILNSDIFHLSALIALDPPIPCGHPISNFLYTTLDELGIDAVRLTMKRKKRATFR